MEVYDDNKEDCTMMTMFLYSRFSKMPMMAIKIIFIISRCTTSAWLYPSQFLGPWFLPGQSRLSPSSPGISLSNYSNITEKCDGKWQLIVAHSLIFLKTVFIRSLESRSANYQRVATNSLKVPKRENFSIAFFAQSEPIWICDIGTSKKIEFFFSINPWFRWFLVLCRILSVR